MSSNTGYEIEAWLEELGVNELKATFLIRQIGSILEKVSA